MKNRNSFSDRKVSSRRILYTPSAFAREALFHLQETGTLTAVSKHESLRSGLASYLFFIVLKGEGTLSYEGREYSLSEGDCIFIDCSKGYFHSTDSNLWTLQWTHFYGKSMPEFYKKYVERGGLPVFRPTSTARFISTQTRLYDTAVSDDYIRDMKINELLSSLLTRIMENSWSGDRETSTPSDSANVVSQIKDYIDIHYKEKLILDELSTMFYMNKYHMVRSFKNRYGVSIINYQINQRINEAKKLLRFSSLSIEEVGIECGFEDANYFSRVFKNVEGSSPSSYRHMWRK